MASSASGCKLTTFEGWKEFFEGADIPKREAEGYARIMLANRVTRVSDLTKEILQDLEITTVGDILDILRAAKQTVKKETKERPQHRPNIQAPQIKTDITPTEFRKFKIDWDVYKNITHVPEDQIAYQIYTACDNTLQSAIIATEPTFFDMSEKDILDTLEHIVTKSSNPAVHRLNFCSIHQTEGESIQSFVVRLRSAAIDCSFSCPNCHYDLSPTHIQDQLIKGINNPQLQADILAKALTFKDLEETINHAKAFESALKDQVSLQEDKTSTAMKVSEYKKQSSTYNHGPRNSSNNYLTKKNPTKCIGCGSTNHSSINIRERKAKCPAWGKTCHKCNRLHHFASQCRQESKHISEVRENDDDESNTIGCGHIHLVEGISTTAAAVLIHEIPATITPITANGRPTNAFIFPDSGAGICLASPKHLESLGINTKELDPTKKKVMAVGGSILTCSGSILARFTIKGKSTIQKLYICPNVDRIYFSREACTEIGILPATFPYPMDQKTEINSIEDKPLIPDKRRPKTIPFRATEDNIPKLKQHLIDSFPGVFQKSTPFRTMNTKPAHIHLKEDATPVAVHTPTNVPLYWRDEVKTSLDNDVKRGIIEPVPIGEPANWCSRMVVLQKKDGRPRRTVDLQALNSQCLRETHHTDSPFKLASLVPPNSRKTVLDATDGYHAIPLDEESRPLTTFITEWGRYRYKRLPQGYTAAGDAYTRRYDEILKETPRKVKCIDDVLLWDNDIESAFFHVWDYLQTCDDNGITLNATKFQFCQHNVNFAGLQVTSNGIQPSKKILSSIEDFPRPKDVTGAKSWFGLVSQIAWSYSLQDIMQPFRELTKKGSTFTWNESLEEAFTDSKKKLIQCCIEGVQTFDLNRETCLQTDWSKEGIGYLLLQKHCSCPMDQAPVCCTEGWRLVFAGSRFTKDAETRYSPTEGEALAVAWALEHAKTFVLGCNKLTISTDHKPLLGILQDRQLDTITNQRLANIKERTNSFKFKTKYNPGKWHRAPDALSRNPVASHIYAIFHIDIEETILIDQDNSPSKVESLITDSSDLEREATNDREYNTLLSTVIKGFPKGRDILDPNLKPYWNVRDKLSFNKNLVYMDGRIVIPSKLRPQILKDLHSAHQGTSSMYRRASQSVYWPGMEAAIHNTRFNCQVCNENAPSQPKEPYQASPSPLYPFQQICLDYFTAGNQSYLSCVDRFSGWITITHYPHQNATCRKLIATCRSIFSTYGVPEEISSDGGPQFTAEEFKSFLTNWGIKHRLSSVGYPQSNGRAELGVKTSKRLIQQNTAPDGSLDTDKALKAILQHRNTPIPELGLSPAQLLLHRQLRDSIPVNKGRLQPHKEWVIAAQEREKAFAKRNSITEEKYNTQTKTLNPLKPQTIVRIQENGKWSKTGRIVECLPYNQYRIKVDGSGRVTTRNRRFIKVTAPPRQFIITPSPPTNKPKSPESVSQEINAPTAQHLPNTTDYHEIDSPRDITSTTDSNDIETHEIESPRSITPTARAPTEEDDPRPSKTKGALKRLKNYNNPGHQEASCPNPQETPHIERRLRGGREY